MYFIQHNRKAMLHEFNIDILKCQIFSENLDVKG